MCTLCLGDPTKPMKIETSYFTDLQASQAGGSYLASSIGVSSSLSCAFNQVSVMVDLLQLQAHRLVYNRHPPQS